MVPAARLGELGDNLHLAATNRQPVLKKAHLLVGEYQALNGMFNSGPQFIDQVHIALPAYSTQPRDFQAVYRLAQCSHIGLGVDYWNVDESPFTSFGISGSGDAKFVRPWHVWFRLSEAESTEIGWSLKSPWGAFMPSIRVHPIGGRSLPRRN